MIWVLCVLKPGSFNPITWYFDVETQYRRAYNYAKQRGMTVLEAHEDYLCDSDEFMNWARSTP